VTAASALPGSSSAPSSMVATIVTAYVSNKSAAMPAQSPTLSPTLSAMTAGLRGSSSGMPASTLPTRSAPTSAPLVNIPPPSRGARAERPGDKDQQHDADDTYGGVLTIEIRLRARLNRRGNLAHALVTGRLGQNPAYRPATIDERGGRADEREDQCG